MRERGALLEQGKLALPGALFGEGVLVLLSKKMPFPQTCLSLLTLLDGTQPSAPRTDANPELACFKGRRVDAVPHSLILALEDVGNETWVRLWTRTGNAKPLLVDGLDVYEDILVPPGHCLVFRQDMCYAGASHVGNLRAHLTASVDKARSGEAVEYLSREYGKYLSSQT